jgi:hypothetical protein
MQRHVRSCSRSRGTADINWGRICAKSGSASEPGSETGNPGARSSSELLGIPLASVYVNAPQLTLA